MFGYQMFKSCVLMFILFLGGCGALSNDMDGISPDKTAVLDGEFEYVEKIEKGKVIAFDMNTPVSSGFQVIGASFDPDILKLEGFLEYERDGKERVQYDFRARKNGSTDVLIKMKPRVGGGAEVYKRITVFVGED